LEDDLASAASSSGVPAIRITLVNTWVRVLIVTKLDEFTTGMNKRKLN